MNEIPGSTSLRACRLVNRAHLLLCYTAANSVRRMIDYKKDSCVNNIEGVGMKERTGERCRKGYVFRTLLRALISIVFILSYSPAAHAVQVTLAWDPPATGSVDGYRVFSRLTGQGYNYSQPAWDGTATTCPLTLPDGQTYYFVARAYNGSGESDDSNEATYQPATSTPTISRTPASLSASCTQGANASSQSFQVSNSGGGTLSYTISDDVTWLSCSPSTGASTGEQDAITVTYSTSGLSAGTYSGTITVAATGASNTPQTIPVSLTVSAPPPPAAAISRTPTTLSSTCTQGTNVASQSFEVWNSGGGNLSYTISDNVGWLACNVTSGTSTGEHDAVTVTYSTSTMTAGTYSATITIAATGASNTPQTIPVSLTVNAAPSAISRTPSSLSASCTQGANASSQTFQVSNSGGGTLSYTISDDASWLSCTPTSGTSTGEQDTITVSYSTSGLAAGTYSGTITIAATGASNTPQTIPVSLTVNAAPAAISRTPTTLSPACVQGTNAASQSFEVWNSGGGILSYSVSDNVGWLACNVTSATSTGEHDTVTVTYSTSTMTAGTYSATITVGASGVSNSPQTIPVSLTVVASNLAPAKPVITSPYSGQVEGDPLLTVQTEPFSDPDAGDSHSKSRWQISAAEDFASPVLDVSTTTRLTQFPVPHSVLDRNTTYFVRVQFFDVVSEASEWSDAVEFRTISALVDADQDGIPDSREVDNTADLNGDGIPDNDQPDLIKSAQTAMGNNVSVGVCKDSDAIVEIETLDTIHPSTILDRTNRPQDFAYGLCTYRLKMNAPGSAARVELYYSSPVDGSQSYYVYDTVNGWQDFTDHVTFSDDGRSITIDLQDGGFGDSDGVANGVIVDPGGVVLADSGSSATAITTGGGSDKVGGAAACFIATAAGEGQGDPGILALTAGLLIGGAVMAFAMRRRR